MLRPCDSGKRTAASGAIVPADRLVQRYNELNRSITLMVPAVAVAYDTLARALPLLKEMQQVLSQRPHGTPTAGEFKVLDRRGARILGARLVENSQNLPTWSLWLASFAVEVGYSVRHLRRLILDEPRRRTTKQCGWSRSDHERLLEIAATARQLVRAVASGEGGEIYRAAGELNEQLDASQELMESDWEVDVRVGRKRAARKVTRVDPAA